MERIFLGKEFGNGENETQSDNKKMQEKDVETRITDAFIHMSKGQKAISTFILDHFDEAVFMTAAKLGEAVSVSESTVVRFASELGYEGYPEFQQALQEWVRTKFSSLRKMGIKYRNQTKSEILTSVLSSDIEKIKDTIHMLEPSYFDTAVDIILKARKVYVIGLRSCEPLANFLSFYLSIIRDNVQLINTTSVTEMFEQMIRINEKDAVIGISFPRYSMRTLKAMQFANDRKARVISLTDSEYSPMCMYSSCNLHARTDTVSIVDSLVAPLSVINALVVALCLKRPEAVRKDLEELEYVWNNYQVYLNDEIDFMDEEKMMLKPLWKDEGHS